MKPRSAGHLYVSRQGGGYAQQPGTLANASWRMPALRSPH